MFLELNITDEDRLLFTGQALIAAINICNTGAADMTLGLYKQIDGSDDKFYYLKNVTLKQNNTFLGEDLAINEGDKFYVSVLGSCSIIVDYQ